MRLIIVHEDSDGYTWSCTNTIPVECESEEYLLEDMHRWALRDDRLATYNTYRDTSIDSSCILGKSNYASFYIITLDKWFEENAEVVA